MWFDGLEGVFRALIFLAVVGVVAILGGAGYGVYKLAQYLGGW